MSNTDKMKDEIKKAVGSKEMAKELDRMRPNEIATLYSRLRSQGKVRR